MGRKRIDVLGQTFGRLTPVRYTTDYKWECECSCGGKAKVRVSNLVSGHTQSCGCLHKEVVAKAQTTHGLGHTPEYKIWKGINQRCNNANNQDYKDYGGRGIRVCKRWEKFENFYTDMGMRPSKKHSIDRVNVDGRYSPDNCRWATPTEQARNRRKRKSKLGVTGIHVMESGRYRAQICTNKKQVCLGIHATLEQAKDARKQGELKYWGRT